MKTVHLVGLVAMLILPLMASGQQAGIDAALQEGNAADLWIHFTKSVDLSLPDSEDTYSPDKAVTQLDAFFKSQTVKGYKRVHASTAQGGRDKYTIGDLYTANGTYRITLYYDSADKIKEVSIVK